MTDIDRSVQFRIPAAFIASRALLTPRELHCGYRNDWLSDADMVQLAMGSIVPEIEPMQTVEELSLLLSDELDKVAGLANRLTPSEIAVWMYLSVSWVYDNPGEFDDNPWQAIEMLYADFEYPEEMEPFIPYMPAPEGAVSGVVGLEKRLREYLVQSWNRFHVTRSSNDQDRVHD
jgi:hypothetical protein